MNGPVDNSYVAFIPGIAATDAKEVIRKDAEYGASWKRRGGTGAYHVAMRKIDRLETQVLRFEYDIFRAIEVTRHEPEPLIETIRDARGYFLLWEAECVRLGFLAPPIGQYMPVGQVELREHVTGFVAVYTPKGNPSGETNGWPSNTLSGAIMNLAMTIQEADPK